MKKVFIIFIALLISASAFSQEDFLRNEIRINLFPSFVFVFPEITYERILNENFSVGVSAGVSTFERPTFRDYNIVPFGRLYFGEQPARGFFIEVNAAIFAPGAGIGCGGGPPPYPELYEPFSRFSKMYFGAGLAAGGKRVTRNNWVWEAMIGLGRGNGEGMAASYMRWGVSFGRRF